TARYVCCSMAANVINLRSLHVALPIYLRRCAVAFLRQFLVKPLAEPFDLADADAAFGVQEPLRIPGPPARQVERIERLHQPSARSEEHTSELQSRENLVCRLLLDKKKL